MKDLAYPWYSMLCLLERCFNRHLVIQVRAAYQNSSTGADLSPPYSTENGVLSQNSTVVPMFLGYVTQCAADTLRWAAFGYLAWCHYFQYCYRRPAGNCFDGNGNTLRSDTSRRQFNLRLTRTNYLLQGRKALYSMERQMIGGLAREVW